MPEPSAIDAMSGLFSAVLRPSPGQVRCQPASGPQGIASSSR